MSVLCRTHVTTVEHATIDLVASCAFVSMAGLGSTAVSTSTTVPVNLVAMEERVATSSQSSNVSVLAEKLVSLQHLWH